MSQIQVDNIYNKEATGSPSFPLGANVTGVITATTFKGGAEITSGTISATSVTAASGTFNGPVTIGGTLTYEDVTNIDSVGVITARNGLKVNAGGVNIAGGGINAVGVVTATNDIKANGNIIGDNSTNISGVSSVTATNFYGNGASLSGIEAAPTIQLNATGAIAQDQACIAHTDGTVKKVQLDITHQTPVNYELRFSSSYSATNLGVAYNKLTKQIATLHRRGTNGYLYATAGKDNGSNWFTDPYGDTTGDTEKSVNSTNSYPICAVADLTSGKFIFTIRNASNNEYKAQIYEIESDGTFHTSVQNAVIYSGGTSGYDACYAANAGKVVLYYRKTGDGNKCYARTITTSSSDFSYTLGTEVVIADFATDGNTSIAYDSTTSKVIFTYKKTSDDYTYARVGTVESNGSITLGSEVSIFTTNGENEQMQVVSSPVDGKVVFIMGVSGSITIRIGSVTGSGTGATISSLGTAGTDSMFNDAAFYAAYDESAQRVAILWNDGASSNNASVVTMIISGTSFTFGTKGVNLSEGALPIRTNNYCKSSAWIYTATSASMLHTGNQTQWSNKATIRGVKTATAATNLTTENFMGFSKAAYTNGQTATIKVVGNTTTKSGLTPGQKYYVQTDGTLDVNPATPSVDAGLAVSATSLLIK